MYELTHYLTGQDGHKIFMRQWKPTAAAQKPKAIVHICHGMAEHSQRYASVAQRLVEDDFFVFAHDHRGHGHSVRNTQELGHYGDKNGFDAVVNDVVEINTYLRNQYIDVPIFLLGHSMGSFITQTYVFKHHDTIDGVILSGSTYNRATMYRGARMIANIEKTRMGQRGRSVIIDKLSFGNYNDAFKPSRTDFDWLTRDADEVNKYLQDPLCGFICTNQTWADLMKGLENLSTSYKKDSLPSDLPYYVFAGDKDPLSANNNGIRRLCKKLSYAGIKNITMNLYEDARHEMLNESNRIEVISDLHEWLQKNLNVKNDALQVA